MGVDEWDEKFPGRGGQRPVSSVDPETDQMRYLKAEAVPLTVRPINGGLDLDTRLSRHSLVYILSILLKLIMFCSPFYCTLTLLGTACTHIYLCYLVPSHS